MIWASCHFFGGAIKQHACSGIKMILKPMHSVFQICIFHVSEGFLGIRFLYQNLFLDLHEKSSHSLIPKKSKSKA